MGIARFEISGIQQVVRGHLSIGYGDNIRIQADTLPQFGVPNADVTVVVGDEEIGGIVIPGCRIDRANITLTTSGHVVRVQLFGPTWRLRKGSVDGVYNVVRPDGTIDPDTRRSVRELAELLFQAMRWPLYDVSGLPSISGPSVNWQGHNAYAELIDLCHSCGCDFGLDILAYPMIRVWRMGVGAGLPTGGFDRTQDYGIDIGEPPDAVKAYCSPTRFQSLLKMRCLLPQKDGTLKPYEDVDYAPSGGWDGVDPSDPLPDSTDKVAQALAKKWLYRLWGAEAQADGTGEVPGYGTVDMANILPLYDELAEDYTDDVLGMFEQRSYLQGTIAVESEPQPMKNSPAHTRIDIGHRVIGDAGLVVTDGPVAKLTDDDRWTAADVFLMCSYCVSDQNTRHKVYHSLRRQLANNGTGDQALHRPEFYRRVVAHYNNGTLTGTEDNESTLNADLNDQLDAFVAQFQSVASQVKEYNTIVPMSLDGTRQQVTYTVDSRRGSPTKGCRTYAASNTEWEPGMQRRRQRRREAEVIRATELHQLSESERRKLARRGLLK